MLTTLSNIISELQDEISADRGFLNSDELACLPIPQFLSAQGKPHHVCIHVEPGIGQWKNFKILQTDIPVSQVNILDDAGTVCGAVTNLWKRAVPKVKAPTSLNSKNYV